ncbi:hypothetical protein [Mesorhizobium sp. 131-2-1]|uniref:hypothetical protein n=1 Tax=Mesorhizobium sp. 131-2-1 TaxID=2744518 RepID=UPI001928463C|nr:hypothetical protein [Mesorhizobium sp. 131-2-1]BCG96910.1 hypothetical protein MesoLj131a_57740 [Mesorhizobium sp. 131-2-1]
MHIVAVELVAKLRDAIEAIKDNLADLDDLKLQALEANLPRTAPAGSPEMVMRLLIYREMGKRKNPPTAG